MPLCSPLAAQFTAIARRARGIGPISTEDRWNGLGAGGAGELGSIDPIAVEKASWDASGPAAKAVRPTLEGWMREAGEIGHCIIRQTTVGSETPYEVTLIGTTPIFSEVLCEDTPGPGDATMVKERLLGRPALKAVVATDENDFAGAARWGRVEFGHYGPDGFAGSVVIPFSKEDLAPGTPGMDHITDWKHPDLIVGLLEGFNRVLYTLGGVAIANGVSRQRAF